MRPLLPVSTILHRTGRSVRTRLTERRLRRSDEPLVRAVGDGLRQARRSRFDPVSLAWFERIEQLRASLAESGDRVEVVNYGAGLRTSPRTDAEMRAGSVSHPVVGPLSVSASLPAPRCRQLHAIVQAVGVRRGIELGTCFGISAAYQASALDDAADARFVTCEGAPGLAELAGRNLRQLGLRRCSVVVGRFDDTLPAVSAALAPIDYAFVDGHHDEAATKRYFDLLLPHAATRAVFVFDDIRWSSGMERAWQAINSSPDVIAAADLRRTGVVIVNGKAS